LESGSIREVNPIHIASHPIRFRILNMIDQSETPPFISQIAEELKINHRLASFHLGVLQQNELATGTWTVSDVPRSKGKAVKAFTLTEKARQILEKLKS